MCTCIDFFGAPKGLWPRTVFSVAFLVLASFPGWFNCASAQEDAGEMAVVEYPISVAIAPDSSVVFVDLNLPGVWRVSSEGGAPELVYRGTKLLRKTKNRPRCCVVLADGGILVGDTATREIYRIAPDGAGEPKPLTGGKLGIPNSLALSGDGKRCIVADLETRYVWEMAIEGGEPTVFSKVNARGVFSGENGQVFAVTPTSQPLVELVAEQDPKVIVGNRAFEFPHLGGVLPDGSFLVTDGYAKALWHVSRDGIVEPWLQGEPFKNPVGIAAAGNFAYVADPHAKQVFRIQIDTKEVVPLLRTP